MKKRTFLTVCAAALIVACGKPAKEEADTPVTDTKAASKAQEVNVYSSRHYDTDLKLYSDFTDVTGIKVNLIEAGADALIERIKNEGEFSPADMLITVDGGRLWRAVEADVLDEVDNDVLEARIPSHLRHPDGLWFGLSKRARVIIYNKANGKPAPLDTYADLADPANKGKVCIRSSSNIYNISLVAAMISHAGAEGAEDWAKGVVANFARKPQGNDTAQIEAVASGECQIGLVNSYYLARLAGSDEADRKAIFDAVGIVFPDQGGRGTHVNISGAGIVKGAPNRDNAVKFLEYLTSETAQGYFANGNNEYPVVEGVALSSPVATLGDFTEDTLNVSALGENQAEAIRVFDRAGWQ